MLSLSLSHDFPEDYRESPHIWPMLLSDIFHHVVDALADETGLERHLVQDDLKKAYEEVLRSERGIRAGTVKEFKKRVTELPDPDVTGDDHCVEIIRIILLDDSIRVIVRVGMWLEIGEEEVWGNLLYDLCSMIASSLDRGAADSIRDRLSKELLHYIDNPSTVYSGEFYGNEGKGR